MLRRRFAGIVAGVALAPVLVGAGMPPAYASETVDAAVTLTYDASQTGEFADEVAAGVESWNASVDNVEFVAAQPGATAEITIVTANDWPHATMGPVYPGGHGEVVMGRQAVDEGHDPTRIAAHELGHILGLPDHYEGPCSELMSGHGPGTSCTNAKPDANEVAAVEQNYAESVADAA